VPDFLPIYAGSFDPFTFGHAAVVSGAIKAFGRVRVAIGVNPKKKGLFTVEERSELIQSYKVMFKKEAFDVASFQGLFVDYCTRVAIEERVTPVLVRGLRAVSDFEQEMAIADANHRLSPDFQTIFIPTEAERAFVSSSVVKEIASNTKEPAKLIPYVTIPVAEKLLEKLWASGS